MSELRDWLMFCGFCALVAVCLFAVIGVREGWLIP